MATCMLCSAIFVSDDLQKIYCSVSCRIKAMHLRHREGRLSEKVLSRKCGNCLIDFKPVQNGQFYCSAECRTRINSLLALTRKRVRRAASARHRPERASAYAGPYTLEEITALRADPHCVLPNRTLRAQSKKCAKLGILRDPSLFVRAYKSPEAAARAEANRSTEYITAASRRRRFRHRVRGNPEPFFEELRRLARGHQHAEDLIVEGFATVLRLAIPAAEAFKLAKVEVNRTSAQPFREQSFNPDIDYAGRETGRQVSRASDIRAARGEG